jgi:hypothetical protein
MQVHGCCGSERLEELSLGLVNPYILIENSSVPISHATTTQHIGRPLCFTWIRRFEALA